MLRLDIRWGMAIAAMVAAMAADASAQQLLEIDGIELLGEAQLVMSGGGTCNVLETDTLYEERKGNDGAPMDVWRLDFSVRNGSGRWLDHLIARFQIESEWPDCTNWDGPEAGEVPQNIEWADSIGHIQESGRNVVGPGETLTETKHFIVLQGDPPPQFANWSMDFDFAVNPPEVGAAAVTPAASATGQQPAAATPEQENLFWQSIVNSTNPTMFEAYLEQFPNGVFRALAEARLAELRAPGGDRPASGGPRGGRAGSPTAGVRPAADRDAPLRAGETRVFDGMEFVWVPAGEFRMGSTSSEADYDEVLGAQWRISRGFWMGKYEVTQAEWQGVMGSNPSEFADCGRSCPVETVSWDGAQEFIGRLNGQAGGNRYRLPTEAEWEYAARAGTTGDRYAANLDAIAWYDDNSEGRTHPVGQKAPNAWGLHDMLGNVYEWVADWYDSYPRGTVTDPRGPASGSFRVTRGGGWVSIAGACRSSDRNGGAPGNRYGNLGFRLLRTE